MSSSEHERECLLGMEIENIYFGLRSLAPGALDVGITVVTSGFRSFLPWWAAPPMLYYATLFVLNKYGRGVLIEYGNYQPGDQHDHPNNVYYWKEDGIRFTSMSWNQYLQEFPDGISTSQRIGCKTKHHPTIKTLLNWIHSGDTNWRSQDYFPGVHDSQDFVARCLKELGAQRNKPEEHTISKAYIPHAILEVLEGNENNSLTTVEKIPVIGTYIGLFHSIFS